MIARRTRTELNRYVKTWWIRGREVNTTSRIRWLVVVLRSFAIGDFQKDWGTIDHRRFAPGCSQTSGGRHRHIRCCCRPRRGIHVPDPAEVHGDGPAVRHLRCTERDTDLIGYELRRVLPVHADQDLPAARQDRGGAATGHQGSGLGYDHQRACSSSHSHQPQQHLYGRRFRRRR